MGNSNIVQTQSESNSETIQLFYHSKLYGKHKINSNLTETVEKRYIILSEHENHQFQSLVNTYQQIRHPSIIQMETVDMQPLEGQEKIKYIINYQYCPSNLNAQIYMKRLNPYGAGEVLEMIEQITQALDILTRERFPCGVLTPQKIGLINENGRPRYCLTVDLLMNGDQYRNLEILRQESTKKYLSPQQQTGKNISTWDDTHSQALVYSLGLIALKMIYAQDIPRQKIRSSVFHLREKFCYEFAMMISGMVEEIPANRIILEEIQEEIKTLKKDPELQGNQRILKRGYNCLEYTYFFDETPVTRKFLNKLPKESQDVSL